MYINKYVFVHILYIYMYIYIFAHTHVLYINSPLMDTRNLARSFASPS